MNTLGRRESASGFIPEDAPPPQSAAGVHRKHCHFVAVVAPIIAVDLDEGALGRPGTPVTPTRMEWPAFGSSHCNIC